MKRRLLERLAKWFTRPAPRGCSMGITAQLLHIALLEDGWYDGDGRAYTDPELTRTNIALRAMIARDRRLTPWIYPSPDGTIRAEWEDNKQPCVVVFRDGRVEHSVDIEEP